MSATRRREAHQLAVKARTELANVTLRLHGAARAPRTAEDWLQLAQFAAVAAKASRELAALALAAHDELAAEATA